MTIEPLSTLRSLLDVRTAVGPDRVTRTHGRGANSERSPSLLAPIWHVDALWARSPNRAARRALPVVLAAVFKLAFASGLRVLRACKVRCVRCSSGGSGRCDSEAQSLLLKQLPSSESRWVVGTEEARVTRSWLLTELVVFEIKSHL